MEDREEYYTPDTYTVEDRGGVLHTRHIHSGRQGGVLHTRHIHSGRQGAVMLLIKDNLNMTPFLLAIQRQKSNGLQYPHTLTYSGKLEYAIGQKIRHTCYKR